MTLAMPVVKSHRYNARLVEHNYVVDTELNIHKTDTVSY